MGDEELLEWIATARAAGDLEHAREGCGNLAYRYEDRIQAKIRLRTDPKHADDIFMEVMLSVSRSAFDGTFMGQFGSWINTITHRRIVDFYRTNGEALKKDQLFAEEHSDEEGVWVTDGLEDDDIALLAYREIAETIRNGRIKETHRLVIKLYGPVELEYLELDAASTCEHVERITGESISEANVHKIWARFKADFKAELERAEGDAGGDGS